MTAEKEMAVRDEETLDSEAANAIGGALAPSGISRRWRSCTGRR